MKRRPLAALGGHGQGWAVSAGVSADPQGCCGHLQQLPKNKAASEASSVLVAVERKILTGCKDVSNLGPIV